MFHEQPLHRLHGNAGRGPGRAIAEGHFTGIGEAGFQRRALLAIDDGNLVSGLGKLVSGRYADNAGAENDDFHNILSRQFRPS